VQCTEGFDSSVLSILALAFRYDYSWDAGKRRWIDAKGVRGFCKVCFFVHRDIGYTHFLHFLEHGIVLAWCCGRKDFIQLFIIYLA
jgi:hypothetical protein